MKYSKDFLFSSEHSYAVLAERRRQLEAIIEQLERNMAKAPEGKIHVIMSGRHRNNDQYYIVGEDGKDKYIKRDGNEKLIGQLIQKEYEAKILSIAKKESKGIEHLLRIKGQNTLELIYERLPVGRRKWIEPIVQSREEYVEQWSKIAYEYMGGFDGTREFITRRGEHVRSKSEVIIANILNDYNIPYKYEMPLTDNKIIWARPDFCVLNVSKRKKYYWEHFGMMDNPQYAATAIKKISNYRLHGIYEGEQLLITYETSSMPVNTNEIELIIKKFLI